jgi:hypothetical protein
MPAGVAVRALAREAVRVPAGRTDRVPAGETDRERPALDGRVGGGARLPSGRFHRRIVAK